MFINDKTAFLSKLQENFVENLYNFANVTYN